MSDYYNVTTNVGDAAIATAIANVTKLDITHITFGDGNGSVPTPNKSRTSLVNEVHRQAVTKYARHATIANYIVIETIIPSNIGGFWIREMGIIAGGVLISHGSHAPFFKVADPDGVSEYRLKFTQDVRDGSVVEIRLDESLIYATQAWVDENYIPRDELVDNLTTDDSTKPVTAKQAKLLNDRKSNISDIVDNLTSTATDKPLSANLGRHLNESKLGRTNNLSDLNSIDIARQNLNINRVGQLAGETNLTSPTAVLKIIVSDSTWGCYDISNNTTKALTLPYGGTGGKTADEACSNLNLDALLFSPIPHPASIPPTGYLAMQGQTISAATYPKLYALYGSTLPDLRGEFIRGWDNGRGADSGRSLRTTQGDAIRNITGVFQQPPPVVSTEYAGGAFYITRITENTNGGGSATQKDLIYFDASRVVPTASENRPRNISFNYIVKAG